MTSANALMRFGIFGLLLLGSIGLSGEASTQTGSQDRAAISEEDQNADTTIDRGKIRLNLLISLVENELQEATLRHSLLTVEASRLDQERQKLLADQATDTQSEKRQIEVIEQRLQQIDKELAEVNIRVPEIDDELAELKVRLDEANGIVRAPVIKTASNDTVIDSADRWLDSKRRVQEALVYLGGYNALIDGDFGPRTQAAVKVYQERQNLKQTGVLSDEQEAALLEEADVLRARYGMTIIENMEKGYRFMYPNGLLSESAPFEPDGWRYYSKDGKGELVVTSSGDDEANGKDDLSKLYNELLIQYQVRYQRKRSDWFVVAGHSEDGRAVYDTARISNNRIIRARLSYPVELREMWSPFSVIMFNTFEPLQAGES